MKNPKLVKACKLALKSYPPGTRFEFNGHEMVEVSENTKTGKPNPNWLSAPYELVVGGFNKGKFRSEIRRK